MIKLIWNFDGLSVVTAVFYCLINVFDADNFSAAGIFHAFNVVIRQNYPRETELFSLITVL